MTLKEALESFVRDAVLIDDDTDCWGVDNLIDAFNEGDNPAWGDQEVYACENYITALDGQGYQVSPAMFTVLRIGETPYFVSHESKGYRVKFMINEEAEHFRYIYGQSCYEHKQAAYRRKDGLNEDWQKHRLLGA